VVNGPECATTGSTTGPSEAVAPTAAPPRGAVTQVSADGSYNCALGANGVVTCWASGYYKVMSPSFSQVPPATVSPAACGPTAPSRAAGRLTGQVPAPSDSFSQVSAGYEHACGRSDRPHRRVLGSNSSGQASPPAGSFSQVSAVGSSPAACGPTAPSCAGATLTRRRRRPCPSPRSPRVMLTPAECGPTAPSCAGCPTPPFRWTLSCCPRRPAPSPRSPRVGTTPAGCGPTAPSRAGDRTAGGNRPLPPVPSPRSLRQGVLLWRARGWHHRVLGAQRLGQGTPP